MRKLILTLLFALAGVMLMFYSGCSAARITGEIMRGDSQKFEAVLSGGISSGDIALLQTIGLSVNGINKNGEMVVGIGGQTNTNVFTDMYQMEFMKAGYNITAMNENANDLVKPDKLDSLSLAGIQLMLICNNNLAGTTSELDWLTGGEAMKAGVNNFTFKGFRTEDKKLLFIASGVYEKTRTAEEVSKDVVNVFNKIVQGKISELNKEENTNNK